MFCSTIIPTINRPSLSRAVTSVLEQRLEPEDFEVIVVNDSGRPLPEFEWMRSPKVKVLNTQRRERSVARNAGAATALGKYLHFLDDDDWMLPEAFEAFWELSNLSQAEWLYGAFQLINGSGALIKNLVYEFRDNCFIQSVSSEWVPLQASLIKTEAFFNVGGFAPLQSSYEDIDLTNKITHRYPMSGTPKPVVCIQRGGATSTTNQQNVFHQRWQTRENALNLPGAFSRLHASANSSNPEAAYWNGRIAFYYLASILWNIRQKRCFTACSRALYSLMAIALAGKNLLKASFWRGATRGHALLVNR